MITPEQFLQLNQTEEKSPVRFGYIDSAYVTGRPKVKFDGEDTASGKQYPYLASYTPKANDRIMILYGVIQGRVI